MPDAAFRKAASHGKGRMAHRSPGGPTVEHGAQQRHAKRALIRPDQRPLYV
jgi:hypothetical protein